jgi:hypothetical protein
MASERSFVVFEEEENFGGAGLGSKRYCSDEEGG